MKAIYYDTQTGLVTKAIEASQETIDLNTAEGEAYIEGELDGSPSDYMVVSGALQRKPDFNVTVQGAVLSNIPQGTYVTVGFQAPVKVDDGVVELAAQYEQQITVSLYNPAYIPLTLKVNV